MSNYVIHIKDLSKKYNLYSKPKYRVMHTLGIPISKAKIQEFWALHNINLIVKRGSKLAIVGRNGAGKSTLLKIIAGQIKPTSGEIEINGSVQALMDLGTGFHPEFTGMQNIIASLAYMGITGKKARREAEEIIEFAELEEFINNPLKTYSSGMYARLSFSVATVIKPELLIIDEILGAGDSYFANKALQRMKDLTQGGATVLFVSHDMSAVERLCDDAIWIDRGKIIMRGATLKISKAYTDVIRQQEQVRLQAQNSKIKLSLMKEIKNVSKRSKQIIFRLESIGKNVGVRDFGLLINNTIYEKINVGEDGDSSFDKNAFILVDKQQSQWTDVLNRNEEKYRELTGKHQVGKFIINVSDLDKDSIYKVHIHSIGDYKLQIYNGTEYEDIMTSNGTDVWTIFENIISPDCIKKLIKKEEEDRSESKSKVKDKNKSKVKDVEESCRIDEASVRRVDDIAEHADDNDERKEKNNSYEIFTGDIELISVLFHNGDKQERYLYNSFDDMYIELEFKALRELYNPDFVVCFHTQGLIALQAISSLYGCVIEYMAAGSTHKVKLHIPKISFGRGKYYVSIGVFPKLDMARLDTERDAFLLQDRCYEIQVEQPEGGSMSLGLIRSEHKWMLN